MDFATSPLVASLNHLLARNAWALPRLRAHAGSILRFEVSTFALRFTIEPTGYFAASTDPDDVVDVVVSVPLSALPALAMDSKGPALGKVRIEGNAELADSVSFVLRNLTWDLEEELAAHVGDIPAHRLGLTARGVWSTSQRAASGLVANIRDFLVEEHPTLTAHGLIVEHERAIRTLRDDIARIEKRIARLKPARA